jgi:hypothetical protein
MRAGAGRQQSRLRVAPIFVLAVAALLADAVIAEGRVRRDLTLQTGHLLAVAYQEARRRPVLVARCWLGASAQQDRQIESAEGAEDRKYRAGTRGEGAVCVFVGHGPASFSGSLGRPGDRSEQTST